MSFTNVGKAKDVFEWSNFKDADKIIDGTGVKINIDWKDEVQKIFNNSIYSTFNALDISGNRLKGSKLTRSTSHKKYDFASIQSISSLNWAKFLNDIHENKYGKVFDADSKTKKTVDVDQKTKKQIDKLGKELTKHLNNALKVIKSNPYLVDKLKRGLIDINSNSGILRKIDDLLPDGINFSKEAKDNAIYPSAAKAFNIGTITSLVEMTAALGGTALTILGGSATLTAIGFGMLAGNLFIGLPITAGLVIAGCVVLGDKERFGTIAAKKETIKINDEFRKALRCINTAAVLVRRNATGDAEDYKEVPKKKHKKMLTEFVKKQNNLWKPYTNAEGREYTNKSKRDKESGKHKSGLIKVKDEKTTTIGKMKLGIAKTWSNMTVK